MENAPFPVLIVGKWGESIYCLLKDVGSGVEDKYCVICYGEYC